MTSLVSPPTLGAALGAAFGLGTWLLLSRGPWQRPLDLGDRLEPFLRDAVDQGRRPTDRHRGGAGALLLPVMSDAVRWAGRVSAGSGSGSVRRRLEQCGSPVSLEEFRVQQVVWGVGGLVVGVVLAAVAGAVRGPAVLPTVALVVGTPLAAALLRDRLLTWAVRRREERMLREFPTVAELLALAVGAGEGAVGALDRVAATCSGELSAELARALSAARAGAPLVDALDGMARRTRLPALTRFVDGVVVAVDRGTPLADVLRAQAQDVREDSRRRLTESGGRREIAMMVPVVMMILPVTVLFAVYPGLVALRLEF